MTSPHPQPSSPIRRSLLITGGAGFIGANFVHYWLRNHPEDRVVVLDALTYAGNLENLVPAQGNPHFRFAHGDIRDYDLICGLMQSESIDTVVHFAAESHVDRSILGPDAFLETNILGTHTLLKAAKKVWLDGQTTAVTPYSGTHISLSSSPRPFRFHHVSTDEVYGSLAPDAPPFTEQHPYRPNSPYAASKAASDHMVRAYHKTYGLPITISNCSNNYGPYHFPEKFIPLMIVNLLQGKSIPIYGDGLNVRDWLYVEDHCRGVDQILRRGKNGETYNIGGNCEKTNLEVVNTICRLIHPLSDPSSLLTFIKDRPGHDRRYAIDATKIKTELMFRPEESFASGLRKTIAWFMANKPWWQKVIDGTYRDWIALQYR